MLAAYARWLMAGREPVAAFYGGISICGFASFSEYWSRRSGVDPVDLSVLELVSSIVPSGEAKVAIDAGANLGTVSLAMAKAGFDRIYAFEPVPKTYHAFLANLERNPDLAGQIVAEPWGLAAHPGETMFDIRPNSPGQNKMSPATNPIAGALVLRCDMTTVDRYLGKLNGKVALLKIDVEGFECEVLKGADKTLRSGRIQFIYSEVIPQALLDAGSSLEEFGGLLSSYGFEPIVFSPTAPDRLLPTTLHDALSWAGARRNVLFRRKDNRN